MTSMGFWGYQYRVFNITMIGVYTGIYIYTHSVAWRLIQGLVLG